MHRITLRALAATAAVLAVGLPATADIVITGVYDGPLSGGTPKGVELYVLSDIADLSAYGLGSANNGGGTDGEEFTFPADPTKAGQFLYVTSNAAQFEAYFGFPPDYVSSAMSINGDDAVELFEDGIVIDVFGDRDVDGTGQPWEYKDGWAYRVSETGPDGLTFVFENWGYSGPDALDGCSTNDTCGSVFPFGSYTAAAGGPDHVIMQVDMTFDPASIEVAIGDTIQWVWTDGSHTTTSGSDCTPDGIWFDSPLDKGNQYFEWTVPDDAPSNIDYLCDIWTHCEDYNMVGVLIVTDGGQTDSDGDGVYDGDDNCPDTPNPGQEDCDGDGVGDACDSETDDCNGNGVPDHCDIADETSDDCNENGVPDECDLADGTLHDEDGDGIPDECEFPVPAIQLQEIRIDQPGGDIDEYFEIRGDAGTSLEGVWYIVIGDQGDTNVGVVEAVVDLTGLSLTDETFVVAEDTFTLGTADHVAELNFENSDNVTHVLLVGFSGELGDDLDTDDDGNLDSEPWQDTIDGVRIIEDPDGGDHTYLMDESVGPDGDFVPSHVYRCTSGGGSWEIGTYDPDDENAADTPGGENPACQSDCPADINGDGSVNVTDLLIVLDQWGNTDSPADVNSDGTVDVNDLLMLIGAWGQCP